MDAEVIQLQAQDQTAAADANALAQEQAAARRLVVPRWKAAEAAHPGDGPPTAAAAVARPTSTTRNDPGPGGPPGRRPGPPAGGPGGLR